MPRRDAGALSFSDHLALNGFGEVEQDKDKDRTRETLGEGRHIKERGKAENVKR